MYFNLFNYSNVFIYLFYTLCRARIVLISVSTYLVLTASNERHSNESLNELSAVTFNRWLQILELIVHHVTV